MFRLPRTIWHFLEGKRMDTVLPGKMFIKVDDKRMPNFPMMAPVLREEEINASLKDINDFITHQMGKVR